MRSLEKHLDVRLFNRTTRSISTTEAGEKLLAEIAPHFLAIADAVRHLDEIRDEPQGTIRINTSEIAANLIIYPKLQPFVTIFAKFVANLPTGENVPIYYQTSVSSNQYDIPNQ